MASSTHACIWSLLCFLLLFILDHAQGQPTELIPLHYKNFEHHTQASTGQTTGNWFVLFYEKGGRESNYAANLWSEIAAVEEKGAIFAEVEITKNPLLTKRFKLKHIPSAILFRDRKLYRYPGDWKAGAERVLAFADGQELPEGEEVPGELPIIKVEKQHIAAIAALGCVIAAALGIYMGTRGEGKGKKSKTE